MSTRDRPPARRHRTIFAVHLFVFGLALANCAWIVADELKRLAVARTRSNVFEWASIFYHPEDAALLPYVATAVVAFGWGLFLYVRLRRPAYRSIRRLRRAACARQPLLLVAIAAVPAIFVSEALPRGARVALAILSVLACALRRPRASVRGRLRFVAPAVAFGDAVRSGKPVVMVVCILASAALLVAIAVEPVRLAMGPVRLLNEYPYLPERALEDAHDPAVTRIPGREDVVAARRCKLAYESPLEYVLQSRARGQLNHIGHVLNPINEYETGKPLERTYFQYGIGATFLFKWTMDLFGGTSLQTYYRSLLLFVAYWLVFAIAVAILFRDAGHVLASVGLLAAAHYMLGYEALLLAPGINPVLHFLDLPVLLACLRFFRTGRPAPLALGVLGATAALATNRFFGAMVATAFCVSTGMYVLEKAPHGRRALRILALAALVAVPFATVAFVLPRTAGGGVTAQFLLGFLSWRPSPWLVLLTFAYLAGSYLFLLWNRERRDPLKYAVVYLFVYAQGLLLYFYWSGLENHFWPVLPYVGLHLLLMLRTLARSPRIARWEPRILVAAILWIALVVKVGVDGFIAQRATVRRVFASQETHRWPFPRARVIATANPAPITASLAQIERYSRPTDRGICIVSVFDNIIPLLAARHSMFPHFDLQWALFTEEDRRQVVGVVASARPRYVFVGREVEEDVADPWEGAPCEVDVLPEQESARGRLREMRRVLDAISAEYERIETGPLLSVYRRRDTAS